MSGDSLLHQLFVFLIVCLCFGILWGMGQYFFSKINRPIILMVWNGLFILLGGIFLINFLLGFTGHSFVKW